MINSKIINLLLDLGLTEYEARTLATLFKFVETDAPNISRNAEIPKTRVYDVLDKLKNKGLVLEVYGRPKKYKVIDPKEIFKTLVNNKKKELNILDKQVDNLLSKEKWKNNISGVKEKVLQVKNINDYNKLLSQELSSANKEIHGFTHLDYRVDAFKDVFKNNKLNIKLISKPNIKNHVLPEHVQMQEKPHSMDVFVVDRNKVIMSLNDLSLPKDTYHFTVLENNPTLTKALLNHFYDYWE
jgi:sugar-specific transcriptional regulator TrmB